MTYAFLIRRLEALRLGDGPEAALLRRRPAERPVGSVSTPPRPTSPATSVGGGAVIDAHVHLWDRSALSYPWLDALAPRHRLRRAATPARLLQALPRPLDGIVHVEANPADGLAESRWLARVTAALPCPVALIAHVPMTGRDALERLAAQAALPGVVGIRDVATWHPDPAKRRINDPDRLDSGGFRRAVAVAGGLGFCVDLMISSFQAEAAERLARDFPNVPMVLNHCGGPMDHGPEGRALWLDALDRLAQRPNVAIKLSDPMAFRPDAPRGWLLDVLALCLDAFGPARSAYGSDWPVAAMPPADWAGVVAEAIGFLDAPAQAQVWTGTARAIYFDGPRRPLPAGPR